MKIEVEVLPQVLRLINEGHRQFREDEEATHRVGTGREPDRE